MFVGLTDELCPGWADMQGLVAVSSHFEGGMGKGLHANEMLQAGRESDVTAVNVGGSCAAGAVVVRLAF